MSGTIYLIKIGDLYKIGVTNNFDKEIRKLNPTEIIRKQKTGDPNGLKARILRRYKNQRIPETGYLKLNEDDLIDCVNQFSDEGKVPLTISEELGITITASIFTFFIGYLITSIFKINLFSQLSISFAFSSIPMITLFFSGNFGGYETNDLPFCSTLGNRISALIISIVLIFTSFMLFELNAII
tara:strand:- start:24 stop:575 length:552 start_codon:yes stop_codon:yes gene_type:complete